MIFRVRVDGTALAVNDRAVFLHAVVIALQRAVREAGDQPYGGGGLGVVSYEFQVLEHPEPRSPETDVGLAQFAVSRCTHLAVRRSVSPRGACLACVTAAVERAREGRW